jgi:hypothetical protein
MAKLTKKALHELDEAMDQLGGGAPPVRPSKRRKRATTKRKPVRAKAGSKRR